MTWRFVKRVMLWVLISLPVGIAVGALVSAVWGEDADIDRFTSAFNGAVSGAWIGLVGAFAAAATNTIAHDRLKVAGGSEFLTGLAVSYGLITIALALLLF